MMCYEIKKLVLTNEGENPGDDPEHERNTNTDVIVVVEEVEPSGERIVVKYLASFFTYHNILDLARQHTVSGEFLGGTYFYSPNMVLVDRCSYQVIQAVVNHLIDQGEFGLVFSRIS